MQRLFLVPLLSLVLLCAGCREKTPKVSSRRLADESAGRAALARARQQLATQHYDSARHDSHHAAGASPRTDGTRRRYFAHGQHRPRRHSHCHRPTREGAPLSRRPGRTFPPTGKPRSTGTLPPPAVLRTQTPTRSSATQIS